MKSQICLFPFQHGVSMLFRLQTIHLTVCAVRLYKIQNSIEKRLNKNRRKFNQRGREGSECRNCGNWRSSRFVVDESTFANCDSWIVFRNKERSKVPCVFIYQRFGIGEI